MFGSVSVMLEFRDPTDSQKRRRPKGFLPNRKKHAFEEWSIEQCTLQEVYSSNAVLRSNIRGSISES